MHNDCILSDGVVGSDTGTYDKGSTIDTIIHMKVLYFGKITISQLRANMV